MKTWLLSLILIAPALSCAQELLVTHSGNTHSFERFRFSDDGSMIELWSGLTEPVSIPVDSVVELVSFENEKIYHLKCLNKHLKKFASLELVTTGKVNVYRRV